MSVCPYKKSQRKVEKLFNLKKKKLILGAIICEAILMLSILLS